jgi:hypothetical protein
MSAKILSEILDRAIHSAWTDLGDSAQAIATKKNGVLYLIYSGATHVAAV